MAEKHEFATSSVDRELLLPPAELLESGAPVGAGAAVEEEADAVTTADAAASPAAADTDATTEAAAAAAAAAAVAAAVVDVDASDTELTDPGAAPIDPGATTSAVAASRSGGSTRVKRARRRRRVQGRAAQAHRRSVKALVLRSFGTLATIGIVGAGTWALGWAPLPEYSASAEGITITPEPGDQERVCAGGLLQLGLSGNAEESVTVGEPELAIASSTEPTDEQLLGDAESAPIVLAAPGTVSGEPTELSASQTLSNSTAQTSGFAATNCMQPASTQWLLSGATTLGRTLVLDVINPGNAPARVNFTVYDQTGRVAPGLPETVIEPGERAQLSLAGAAPDATGLAVQVTSTGSMVTAFLHETATEVLEPRGSDIVGATALPATTQTLPGLFVVGRPDISATDPAEIGTSLRILNPGSETVTATITAYGDSGEPVVDELEVAAGRVIDLPFAPGPEGNYSVVLEASGPVLLSGRVAPLDGVEFGWVPSSPALVGAEEIPVAPGPEPRLSIFNPFDEEREITIDGTSHTIAARSTLTLTVTPDESVRLEGAAGMSAAVHYSGSRQLASVPVLSGNSDAEPITVVR